MKHRSQKKIKYFGLVAAFTLSLAALFMVFGMSRTISEIRDTVVSDAPSAILASAGVEEGTDVSLPVIYYDQEADPCINLYDLDTKSALENRQFEWSDCGYTNKSLEQGLVAYELNDDHLPVAVGGKLTSNRGVVGNNFNRWFSNIEGQSHAYSGVLKMAYQSENAEFSFYQDNFYPLDAVETAHANQKHNTLFTMNLALPFTPTTNGGEYFELSADDDTFIFLDDKLILDLGGIHSKITARFIVHQSGEVYTSVNNEDFAYSGVNVEPEKSSIIRIFHADRDSADSTFNLITREMNLIVSNDTIASSPKGYASGTEIAYDPSNPDYIPPLGETETFQPDASKGFIILATIEGTMIIVFAILIVLSFRFATRVREK